MLYTKWGENINKNHPLSEYPRPQFVRNSYINLNGIWHCEFSDSKALPKSFDTEIVVPFSPESPLSTVNRTLKPGEYLHYEKEFDISSEFNRGRVFIHFGAVDQIAEVFVNGVSVGSHTGGYTPFSFEITDNIKTGKNLLQLTVLDYSDTKAYSRGKQKFNRGTIWYSPQSGIWQTVWLESTPKEYIEKVKITPNYDESTVSFEYFGDTDVEVSIFDGEKLVAKTKDTTVKIENAKSWSPENPFLYDVVFKSKYDEVKSYFGMRKFSIDKDKNGYNKLFLNNKPCFQNGLLDQGYYPDGYLTPPSNEAMEFDIKYVKECGYNMLRKHIKVEPLLWYYYCDKHGIIVWQDMINGGGKYGLEVSAIPFVGITLDDTKYKNFHREEKYGRDFYYEETKEIIDLLYNVPSIALWTPFNEGWGQFDAVKGYNYVKSLDSTRIIDTTSGWHDEGKSDVISHHIYFTPVKVTLGDRPFVLSEFGGLGIKIESHIFSDKMFGYKVYKSKESITRAYEKLFKKRIVANINKGMAASVYTQLTDVEDELNGLLTYDRKVEKIDKDVIKNINKEIERINQNV